MGFFGGKNHMPVNGKTILLTGATEGLGRSAARKLSEQGANVIIVARNVGRLEETVAELQAAAKNPRSQRFHHISADVSEPNYAEAVLAEAMRWNRGAAPDIVWCVAGMSTPLLWTDDGSMAATRRNMDVNFYGAAEMARTILREWLSPHNAISSAPGQPKPEPKHLVFTASVLAFFTIVGYGPYSPSKWAVRGLADTLVQELLLYPDNPVKVHVVYPATILSPGLERENKCKPAITLEMEKDEPPQPPDLVAEKAIKGLQAGNYFVTVSFLGNLMRCGVLGGSPRNNSFVDTIVSWAVSIIYLFVMKAMNGQIITWAKKHGHPSTYTKG
ncbi:hypothetical protein VTK73DRAFT_1988 [Phialemonium thermophilum]|uniref:3-dehydrosphinganine reductase n=1 Tax=Phialemonium thermophilum TaxID=223376 RepID=A0ABR3X6P7_9PEZI